MNYKRVTLLSGHYGSGKTNIAVNLAFAIKKQFDKVAIADIDIVNPYFRTKDSIDELTKAGIRLICSPYANSNLDIPALPQDIYSITDDRSTMAIVDIGGDDRGALALGRWAPGILEENDYEMLLVVNRFRPLTPDAASTVEVMREIEQAGGIPFTGVVNNSNLGTETTAQNVLSSVSYAQSVCALAGLPLVMTSIDARLYPELEGRIPDLFPMNITCKGVK
ncbi:MAG: hypothetical protein II727_05250 [Oscillospiraceae bacterium]|nr:hypothetical protein [Oscillospiraceae bacterium]